MLHVLTRNCYTQWWTDLYEEKHVFFRIEDIWFNHDWLITFDRRVRATLRQAHLPPRLLVQYR